MSHNENFFSIRLLYFQHLHLKNYKNIHSLLKLCDFSTWLENASLKTQLWSVWRDVGNSRYFILRWIPRLHNDAKCREICPIAMAAGREKLSISKKIQSLTLKGIIYKEIPIRKLWFQSILGICSCYYTYQGLLNGVFMEPFLHKSELQPK